MIAYFRPVKPTTKYNASELKNAGLDLSKTGNLSMDFITPNTLDLIGPNKTTQKNHI
jgi:hypothetical protein